MTPIRHQKSAVKPSRKSSSETINQPPQQNRRTTRQPKRKAKADTKALAALLEQKALAGDLASAKLLVQIAGKSNPAQTLKPAAKEPQGPTWMQRLGLDGPWDDLEDERDSSSSTEAPANKP